MCDENTIGNVQIDLSEKDRDMLVISYVDGHLSDVSKGLFHDMMKRGDDIKDVIYHTVLNEMANVVLAKLISDEKN